MNDLTFENFADTFKENVQKKSRTVQTGVVNAGIIGSVNEVKENFLKIVKVKADKEEIKSLAAKNLDKAIKYIWENPPYPFCISAQDIEGMMNAVFDILNEGIIDFDAAKRIGSEFNFRYRVWRVKYDDEIEYLPHEIMPVMWEYCYAMEHMMNQPEVDQVCLLAWADQQMDGIIHPWIDSCGRMSTALVMWLSLKFGKLPKTKEKKEHYGAMKKAGEFVKYYEECLK